MDKLIDEFNKLNVKPSIKISKNKSKISIKNLKI